MNHSLSDAKEGLVVSNADAFETYKTYSSIGHPQGLLISQSLRLLPLYTLACMRAVGKSVLVKCSICSACRYCRIQMFLVLRVSVRCLCRILIELVHSKFASDFCH